MAIKINNTTVIDDNRNISSVGVATIGSGSSITTINGNTGIVNVGTGITINGVSGNISIAGTLTAAGFNIPVSITSFNPANSSTSINRGLSFIDFTFNQSVGLGTTTGNIVLRDILGVGIQTIGISSIQQISGYKIRIILNNSLPGFTTIFPVIPSYFFESTGAPGGRTSGGFLGVNTTGGTTYSFITTSFTFNSITPATGSTNVGINTNIVLSFNTIPIRGTGTIELKSGSATTGTLIESFDAATSNRITIGTTTWTLDPTASLGYDTTFFTIIPSGAIKEYTGLNTTGVSTHSFVTKPLQEGDPFGGGYLICQAAGVRWIVAPFSTEVTRSWYDRGDATSTAQSITGCTGWFIPSCTQQQNPGYACRQYWDCYNPTYWTDTSAGTTVAVLDSNGSFFNMFKNTEYNVRAFRCVNY